MGRGKGGFTLLFFFKLITASVERSLKENEKPVLAEYNSSRDFAFNEKEKFTL